MAKILSFETGKEIKGRALMALRGAAEVKRMQKPSAGEEGFEPVGYATERLLKPLERRIARSLT